MKEKSKEAEVVEPEPDPTTEVLFLCSYEGCGKTFIDAGALRKHSHIHGERQYVCHYENCGKAFSLDFNLRSHMKTHAQENYHICPYPDCRKRYAHEYKLKNHLASHHQKNVLETTPKYVMPQEKPVKTPKSTTGPASADRPYGCPYEGCEKAYIHEYKLNLHLRREHPGHFPDENAKANDMDEGSDQDAYAGKRGNGKANKQSRAKPSLKLPPSKVPKRINSTVSPANLNVVKKHRPLKEEIYEEEDSEETEEERENIADGWRYGVNNEEDDEETEYED